MIQKPLGYDDFSNIILKTSKKLYKLLQFKKIQDFKELKMKIHDIKI
jgi:hypothetical protein